MKYKTHIVPLVRKKGNTPIVLHYLILHLHLNPLRPNISMHILHTVRFTFPKVLMRRICLVESIFGDHVLHSHDRDVRFRADIVRRNQMLVTLRSQRVEESRQQELNLYVHHMKFTIMRTVNRNYVEWLMFMFCFVCFCNVLQLLSSIESFDLLNADHLREQVCILLDNA